MKAHPPERVGDVSTNTVYTSADRTNCVHDIVRIAIVEDQRDIREGLRFFIDNTPGFRCIGCFERVEDALPMLTPATVDIVLMDLGLPGMSGIDGIRLVKAAEPAIKFIALTIYDDDDRIFEAFCAGASGYLLKKTAPARLFEYLQEVIAGGAPMSPPIASRVVALFRDFAPPTRAEHGLTAHEVRLLGLRPRVIATRRSPPPSATASTPSAFT